MPRSKVLLSTHAGCIHVAALVHGHSSVLFCTHPFYSPSFVLPLPRLLLPRLPPIQVESWLSQAVEIARAPGRARDPAAVVEVRETPSRHLVTVIVAVIVTVMLKGRHGLDTLVTRLGALRQQYSCFYCSSTTGKATAITSWGQPPNCTSSGILHPLPAYTIPTETQPTPQIPTHHPAIHYTPPPLALPDPAQGVGLQPQDGQVCKR